MANSIKMQVAVNNGRIETNTTAFFFVLIEEKIFFKLNIGNLKLEDSFNES